MIWISTCLLWAVVPKSAQFLKFQIFKNIFIISFFLAALGLCCYTRASRRIGLSCCRAWVQAQWLWLKGLLQFSSVAQLCPTLCDPMNRSTPGLPVHHQLPEFTQTHVQRVSDAIQPSHPLSSPSPPDPNPSQHQSLFQWVNSSHEVAKVLEFQL